MNLLPKDIQYTSPLDLQITWNDGHISDYPVRKIRLDCACATCIDEITREKLLKDNMVPEDVRPLGLEYAGKYALHIRWSDGHSTGYYTFDHLRKICSCGECGGK